MTNIRNILLMILALLSLAAGGCAVQSPLLTNQEIDREFTLKTAMQDGRMVYLGVGGTIDGEVNPDLAVQTGETIKLVLINGDGMAHDLEIPRVNVHIATITSKGQAGSAVFDVKDAGSYEYYCTISGHRQAGMEGELIANDP